MADSWKYRRLSEATKKFNGFDRLVDLITTGLFLVSAIAAANRLLPNKLVDSPYLDLSWASITICFAVFLILFINQFFDQIRRHRALSDFELEAALKANRRKTLRRR